jgi:uroporphyrin-III C-methyltransferase/precorrin-2 dehydrogenase/sirohydrochlorin ferrochelatase
MNVGDMTGRGFASLVGAGPGDPDLLTVRAVDRLERADLVLYDGLVPGSVVDIARSAEKVSVARRSGHKTLTQADVCELIVSGARLGQRVVRLKSGDPFVFGRGGEETRALVNAGVPFEIVPGLSAATAGPALAGIPITHRGVSSGFVVVSGHGPEAYEPLLGTLVPGSATVVVLMGMGTRSTLARYLTGIGWRPQTPVAVVVSASRPGQQVWRGTLTDIEEMSDEDRRDEPGVIVIGEVVSAAAMPDDISGFLAEEHTWQPMTIRRR